MNVNLNRRCIIEHKTTTHDPAYGNEQSTWEKKAIISCEVQDVLPSRSEAIKSGASIGAKQSRLRMRYRKDLDSSMRVIIDGVIYQIISDFAELGNRQYVECVIERYTAT
jgi:SPP1 family predicted phage head-tail adaptor